MPEVPRARRFFVGVLWNWIGVALNVAIGLLLSPYNIRKLGSERYGIWVLVFSLVEYLWFFDLGFNTSVTQFVAKYRARNEPDQINRVINTGLLYFCAVGIVFALATCCCLARVELFKIADRSTARFPGNDPDCGPGMGAEFPAAFLQLLPGRLSALRPSPRTLVAQLLIRSVGCALLLYFGFGLKALGVVVVLGQLVGNSLAMLAFVSVFPQMRLSSLYVKFALVTEMWSTCAFLRRQHFQFAAQSGAPFIIGHLSGASLVGYSFPSSCWATPWTP